jgi:hypothetical protein
MSSLNAGDAFAAVSPEIDTSKSGAQIEELDAKLKGLGVTGESVNEKLGNIVGPKITKAFGNLGKAVDASKEDFKTLTKAKEKYSKVEASI